MLEPAGCRRAAAASGSGAERRAGFLGALVLGAGALAAYGDSLRGAFVFDDVDSILRNASIRHLWPLSRALFPSRPDLTASGRPVLNLSFALNYAISGTRPWSYHALNILIHFCSGLALFGLLRRTLLRPPLRRRFGPDASNLALTASLLWTVHPLQTEAVAYVAQRAESLMGLFFLLTLYCFARHLEPAEAPKRRRRWGWLTVGCCLLGMGTKEVMATAPMLVLAYDRCFCAGTFREAWRERRGLYVALGLTWAPLLLLVSGTGWSRGGAAGFGKEVTVWNYLLLQPGAVLHYLKLSCWPHPLVFDYGAPIGRLASAAVPAAALLVALGASAWALVRRRSIGFLGAWFFLILAPSSSVVPIATQTMAEHRMYLPLAAPLILAVLAAYARWGRRVVPACAVAAAALAAVTAERNRVYASPVCLWTDTLEHAPENARAWNDLGIAQLARGRTAEAIGLLQSAVRLEPESASARDNFGLALRQAGRRPEALDQFREAAALAPASSEARYDYGVGLSESGNGTAAAGEFEAALRLAPSLLDARQALANELLAEGRTSEAIAQFETVLRDDPDSPGTEYDLGVAYARLGRMDEAIAHYASAVRLEPDSARARTNLGSALAQTGRYAEAARQFEAALKLDPSDGPARRNLERLRQIAGAAP